MQSKTKWIALLTTVLLLPSCGWSVCRKDDQLNASALYDPPTVTMLDGTDYQFIEGVVKGRGQKWHSDYSYKRAIIIGSK